MSAVRWLQSRSNGRDPEDRELVGKFLRRREEKAFRTLYRRHAPVLHHLILRLVGGHEADADDVMQTTWIRAIEKLTDFRWESSLRCWLTGIALNCSRETLRKRRRSESSELGDIADQPAQAKIIQSVTRIALEKAIAGLPEGYREVLILHDIEGYTHVEIGDLLGIESGTSKSQLARARRAVRARLTAVGSNGNE